MKKITLPLLTLLAVAACRSAGPQDGFVAAGPKAAGAKAAPRIPVQYPTAPQGERVDDYHGTPVPDPYRWLEDPGAPETKAWVAAENKVTAEYFSKIPFRGQIRERLTSLWNYERYGVPQREGDNLYFTKNDGLQNQAVLCVQPAKGGEARVLLDPNQLSADGTTALAGTYFSPDHRYLAYATSGGGSDWHQIRVIDLKTRKTLPDEINWVKVSGAAWGKDGFYYSRYDAPKASEKQLAGLNQFQKVYYHRLGSRQSQDKLVYEDRRMPLGFRYLTTTDDGRFAVLHLTNGKADGNRLLVRDLTDPKQASKFISLVTSYSYRNNLVGATPDGKLLVRTNYKAPRYRLVLIDPRRPQASHWQDVLPEAPDKLAGVSQAGRRLFARYLKDASSAVKVFDEQGKFLHDVELPALGTATGFEGHRTDKAVYYAFTSFAYPTTIYRYDLATNTSTVFQAPKTAINPADYVTTQVFYASKDGTKIPMFVVHRKGVKLNGQVPTYLYGYGGFNISLTPSFSAARMLWLENGGILAVANLRGGGEYGEEWHRAGMTPTKQNVFDDFVAAAEYLTIQGYTSPARLAIAGGSNGGLLVGATMTQHPEVARVAFPAVGVLDMLRYQKFTIGWNWIPEYGTSDNYNQFQNLYRFSPLHNLKAGTSYPATLITTADHDDRVVPAHSFKFAAALQATDAGPNPQLIRVDTNAGHGAGKSTQLQIDEWTDIWTFAYQNMGLNPYK